MRRTRLVAAALVGLAITAVPPAGSARAAGAAGATGATNGPALTQRLTALAHGLGGSVGVVVADRADGRVLWAFHPERRSPLASNTKLFVTGLAAHEHRRIGGALARILRPSDNLLAQRLFDAEGGAVPVTRFARSLHAEVHLVDGSGLSRADTSTPHAVASYLLGMAQDPHFGEWRDALPLAGVNGTLAGRMTHTVARGRCHAKTGTLSGVSALSGYCTPLAGRPIVFSILMSGVDIERARAVQDAMVTLLVARSSDLEPATRVR